MSGGSSIDPPGYDSGKKIKGKKRHILVDTQGLLSQAIVHVEIVKHCDVGKFVVLPKRWVVERSIAWLNRCRRLAKDWECLNRNGPAFWRWASIRLMVRKLCKVSN